ncbi:YckD family protein [Peribacillus deserti]|nr:YckD family protein [Peribacillus deserti]
MKKVKHILIMAVLVLLGTGGLTTVNAETEIVNTDEVKLTQQQKEELSVIHKNILTEKKRLISKYIEFGVLTEEKGQRIINRMDEHYSMLEKEGFMPRHMSEKNNWKHHHPDQQN